MWSQNSVAPWFCKMNPVPSLLETARKIKAVDRLPIPLSCRMMTDALVGEHSATAGRGPQRATVHVSEGNIHRWDGKISTDRCGVATIKLKWCFLESACVCLVVVMLGRYELLDFVFFAAREPLGARLHEQLWRETSRKNNQYASSTTEN